jgi:uncharacterized protein (UPF0332 family)
MAEPEEIERLMRSARVRCRGLEESYKNGEYDKIINEAYNAMYMAARATVNHLGADATSHRAVASIYRKELIGRRVLQRKYQDHLRKIHRYREEFLEGKFGELDEEQAGKIVSACKDFIAVLTKVIKEHPEPIIDYDIGDFA